MSASNGSARVSRVVPAGESGPVLHDLDLERQILAACLVGPHLLLDCDLTDHDFYSGSNQMLWRAMLHLHAEGEGFDLVRLSAHLSDLGQLAAVGGINYLLELDGVGIPAPPLPTKRLKRLSAQRRLRNAAQFYAANIEDPSAHRYLRDFDRARADLEAIEGRALSTHRLDALWKTVGEWGLLSTQPPPREWILMRPDTETNGMANPIGLLPRSEVGFVIAPGAAGKSYLMIQLALSVATGRKWLDYFLVQKPGRVLLALGEESADEMCRRVHQLAECMRLTSEQERMVEENLVLMPLAGELAALVQQDGRTTTETDVLAFLRDRMKDQEWALVMLDPLSRFAGADTEKDNVQATRFIQAAETLCRLPGRPTVLFSHHSNKLSRADDAGPSTAADARGASGLTDGARWCANLTKRPGGGVSLRFTKNNYAPEYEGTVALERTFGGYLRVETSEARERAEDAQKRLRAERDREVRQKVLAALRERPGLSKTRLRDVVGGERGLLIDVVDDLEADGLIVQQPKHAYRISPQQGTFSDAHD